MKIMGLVAFLLGLTLPNVSFAQTSDYGNAAAFQNFENLIPPRAYSGHEEANPLNSFCAEHSEVAGCRGYLQNFENTNGLNLRENLIKDRGQIELQPEEVCNLNCKADHPSGGAGLLYCEQNCATLEAIQNIRG